MRNLRIAITFLTRIPIPIPANPGLGGAVAWYPFVGALVGVVVGGVAAALIHIVPPFVAGAVAVMLGVLVTGAFHEDGLADVADAFAGGWDPAERMRILKDPLHGSYGVSALCGSIVVRVVCVGSFGASRTAAFGCVVAAHTLGRCAAVALLMLVRPAAAASDGLGAQASTGAASVRNAIGIGGGVAIVACATGWWVAPLVAAAILATAAIGWLAVRKIAGVNGDVLGAAEQIVECSVLVVATGLAARWGLWWAM